MTTVNWKLEGYDTLEGECYPLEGEYGSKGEAEAAARARLAELEKTQPSKSSGGQATEGIQDRVYIVAPDGHKSRFVG